MINRTLYSLGVSYSRIPFCSSHLHLVNFFSIKSFESVFFGQTNIHVFQSRFSKNLGRVYTSSVDYTRYYSRIQPSSSVSFVSCLFLNVLSPGFVGSAIYFSTSNGILNISRSTFINCSNSGNFRGTVACLSSNSFYARSTCFKNCIGSCPGVYLSSISYTYFEFINQIDGISVSTNNDDIGDLFSGINQMAIQHNNVTNFRITSVTNHGSLWWFYQCTNSECFRYNTASDCIAESFFGLNLGGSKPVFSTNNLINNNVSCLFTLCCSNGEVTILNSVFLGSTPSKQYFKNDRTIPITFSNCFFSFPYSASLFNGFSTQNCYFSTQAQPNQNTLFNKEMCAGYSPEVTFLKKPLYTIHFFLKYFMLSG